MEPSIEVLLRGTQFKIFVERKITEVRRKYDLKKIDIEILNFLSKSGERNTSKDIQQLLLINKGYISQSVDRMKQAGYLEYIQDEKDRRFVHFHLTEESKPIVEDINHVWENINQVIFKGITEEELATMISVAHKIDQNMSEFCKE